MTQYLTIFSRRIDHKGIVSTLRSFPVKQLELVGTEKKWAQIIIITAEGKITFNSAQQEKPGDEFSRMILGAHNYFRTIKTKNIKQQKRILDLLDECEMAIGVVADPDFTGTDKRLDLVFAIAGYLNAMMFNGSGMIDKDGAMILGSDGSSEVPK
jgi:hypothetical protein